MSSDTLISYYQKNDFNPVHIPVEERDRWATHCANRFNLYTNHLGVPFGMLHGQSVLEFGCNSGENALTLARAGARLTLVEPNGQVWPRLRSLFERFGANECIEDLSAHTIESFQPAHVYDLVIAEGFLHTLSNRDELLKKLIEFLKPGAIGIISFNELYGGLLEYLRRFLLHRACYFAGVSDMHAAKSLELCRRFYADAFSALNASRTLDAWWKDTLVNPFVGSTFTWTYDTILSILESGGCAFYRSSPVWSSVDRYDWYKRPRNTAARHQQIRDDLRSLFPYLVTGLLPDSRFTWPKAEPIVLSAVEDFIGQLSHLSNGSSPAESTPLLPMELLEYFKTTADPRLVAIGGELDTLFRGLAVARKADDLVRAYHACEQLAQLWGTPYHYMAFVRTPSPLEGI